MTYKCIIIGFKSKYMLIKQYNLEYRSLNACHFKCQCVELSLSFYHFWCGIFDGAARNVQCGISIFDNLTGSNRVSLFGHLTGTSFQILLTTFNFTFISNVFLIWLNIMNLAILVLKNQKNLSFAVNNWNDGV